MKHDQVLIWFKLYFPHFVKSIKEWYPNGINSIRIKMDNSQEVVFTINDRYDWRYESVDSFIKHTIRED